MMRDLSEHPITVDEIVAALEDLSDRETNRNVIGGMNPILLRTAARIIKRMEFVFHDIGKGL